MLDQIGTHGRETVSKPCTDFLAVVEHILTTKENPVVAEIGVGVGATTLSVCKRLNNSGQIHCFDFIDSVQELHFDLQKLGYSNIFAHGNTRRTLDSYSWNLAMLCNSENAPRFDAVFLDGAHNFIHDAPAAICAAQLMNVGGLILFDDLRWTYSKSGSMNPRTNLTVRSWFTEEQCGTEQVKLVCDIFFERNPSFERLHQVDGRLISEGRALYRRLR